MKLSRTEANWIASKLLSDAERERERVAQRRSGWLVRLFPPLKDIRPTERVLVLRDARARAARDPLVVVPTIAAFAAGATLYFVISSPHKPGWVYLTPVATLILNVFAQYLRTLAILRVAAR